MIIKMFEKLESRGIEQEVRDFQQRIRKYKRQPEIKNAITEMKNTVVKVTQLCLTLCDPMDCSLPGSSVNAILQARILEWVAIPFSRGIFLTQGLNPGLPRCRQILYCLSH